MKKKEVNRQSFKQTIIIVGIIIAGLAFLANIILACVFPNCATNIFTAISGWVSGIATIILGVVAVRQNRKYKKENDTFMQCQKEENTALIARQIDCTIFNNIINQRCNFVEVAKRRLNEFIKEYNFRKVTLWLAELQIEANNSTLVIDDTSQGALIENFYNGLIIEYADLVQFIKNDWCSSAEKNEMVNIIKTYFETLIDLKPNDYYQIPNTIKNLNEKCSQQFINLIGIKNKYITWLDVDFNMVLTTKSGDIDFIKRYYGLVKEQGNG